MTARSLDLVRPRVTSSIGLVGAVAGLVALSLVSGRLLLEPTHVKLLVAGIACVALFGLSMGSPRALLVSTVLWLTCLGLVRRLVDQFGVPNRLDPLLLVGPLMLAILAVAALRRDAFALRSRLSRAVLALSVLILLGSVNPLGGSLFGGLAGLLFVLVPTLGFWVGRAMDDRAMAIVFRAVAILGVAVAVYGLIQTIVGFPSWDRRWIEQVTVASLNVNGTIRPFATFSSAQEFATYLAIATVVCLGAMFRIRHAPIALAALATLIPALVLESSRGAIVSVIIALGAMLGARKRVPLVVAAGIGALLLAALVVGLRSYGPTTVGQSASSALVSHDVAGLSDPLNSQTSTLGAHWSLLVHGVKSAFTSPVGEGIAKVTIAGSAFGGVTAGTEVDPSNVAVALGLPGLIAYLVIFVVGIRLVYRAARTRGDSLSLIGLGIVVVTMFQWLNGGLYSVALLPWLVLGWADAREPAPE